MRICATCGVESEEPLPLICPLCADERQWVPASGQQWTSLDQLAASGHRLGWSEPEPRRVEIVTEPAFGIGQTAQLITTPSGSVLWDPPGFIDDVTVHRILDRGPVSAIASSHPHMFGVQIAWADALDAPVLVCARDAEWVQRRSPRIEYWHDERDIAPGLRLLRIGGHFPGAAIMHWADGASGEGVVLCGDTVFPNPDRRSVGFMRSYPNKIPLSGAAVRRIADRFADLPFARIVGNFGNAIDSDAAAVVRRSAERHIAWVSGAHDDETGTRD